jgi:hypothetical protein
LSSILFDNKK